MKAKGCGRRPRRSSQRTESIYLEANERIRICLDRRERRLQRRHRMENLPSTYEPQASPMSDMGENEVPQKEAIKEASIDTPKDPDTLPVVKATYKYPKPSQLATMLITPPKMQPSLILNSQILDTLENGPTSPLLDPRRIVPWVLGTMETHFHSRPVEIQLVNNKKHTLHITVSPEVHHFNLALDTMMTQSEDILVHNISLFPFFELRQPEVIDRAWSVADEIQTAYPRDFDVGNSILVWNCGGVRRPDFIEVANILISIKKPKVMVITETRAKMADVPYIIDCLPFDGRKDSAPLGNEGGGGNMAALDTAESGP
ncbi:hypothetical protein COLO4_37512 [Corchorus olitorius]|uniref:Endonuclease/exonuclease/phosphatase n=1 Tax=Corchorus olitorius TaxID=93759 RepID=A0A1R3G146_9ROSI|nr:hypothetical protein COLO4_37512 [Corchorus olitorius]